MSTLPQPVPRQIFWPYVGLIAAASLAPFVIWPRLLTGVADESFLPHKYCYLSNPRLVWLHVLSDTIIALSYLAISLMLVYVVHRARRDIPMSWVFLAFGLFIVACGGTHLMEVITVWKPYYWLAGDVKVVTAIASLATALALPPAIPRLFDLLAASRVAAERKQQLEAANTRLLELDRLTTGLASSGTSSMVTWEWDVATDRVNWLSAPEAVFARRADQVSTVKDVFETVHPEDVERVRASLDRGRSENAEYYAEFRVIWPDGTPRWVIGRGKMYFENGQPHSMVGVNMDITDRKIAEEALRRTEKLAVAGRMAAAVAHEINNPLEAVTNLLFIIRNKAQGDPEVSRYAQMAESELNRVTHITRKTLAFYRDTGSPAEVKLDDLVDEVLQVFETTIRARNLNVVRRPARGVMLTGVANELRQVLVNLVSNAMEAAAVGGSILVDARALSVNSRRLVRITVADNGPGISTAVRERIFEPFFTTKSERGTGLGLYISDEIVRKHGGRIRLRSSTRAGASGSVFHVILPVSA